MKVHDDFKSIEQHIQRARLERSAALGALIGTGLAAAWRGLKRAYAFAARKMVDAAKTHVAPGEPTAIGH